MSLNAELLQQLLNLSEEDRAELAHHLLLSLEPVPFDPDCQAAWEAELKTRMAKVEQGQFKAREWRESLDDIRKSMSEGPTP